MALNYTGIVFLDRNGFLLFSDSIGQVLQFNFPPTVVRDLEIINRDQLDAMIAGFFKQSGLVPFQIAILLSDNLLFEKIFTVPQDEKGQKELELFMDNLPFEHVGSIIFTDSESKFIATNKELYRGISSSFEKLSCTVNAIVPAFVVGFDINQMVQVTPQVASDIYRKAASLRQFSFLTDHAKISAPTKEEGKKDVKPTSDDHVDSFDSQQENKGEKKVNTRLFVLIGLFGLMIVFLVIAIIMMN